VLPQYTTTHLIENIKRRCTVPTSQLTFTLEDFSDLANDTLQGEVVPMMMSTREEYFVEYEDIASPASGQFPIPRNTTANKVRTVAILQPGTPLVLINLPRIDLDVVAGYGFINYNTLAGFYLQDDNICLYPSTSVPAGTAIRTYFFRRTLNLAAPSTFGRVTAINTGTNVLTLDSIPYTWEVGTTLNSVSSLPPRFKTTNEEMTIVSVSNPTVEVDNVTGVTVGDYVSLMGYSAVPQVPIEAHPYLAQLTASKCLESLGDSEGMQVALNRAATLKDGLLILMTQRVDGSVKKIMQASGGLRRGAGLGRWGKGGVGGGWAFAPVGLFNYASDGTFSQSVLFYQFIVAGIALCILFANLTHDRPSNFGGGVGLAGHAGNWLATFRHFIKSIIKIGTKK
jgi:hypothetical protein